jgi:hypothetical protein
MRIPALALFALPLLGCAPTAHDLLGDVAHYAPAFAGYVAGSGTELVLLRDPVTSGKIRCREDLERVAPAVTAAAEDGLHNRHARQVAGATFAPLTLFTSASLMIGTGALFPAAAIVDVSVSANRRDLYLEARDLYIAGRADAAREHFLFVERAQVRDEAAYRQAEERLSSLDPAALPGCRSRAPVTFAWPPPGAASPGQSR